MIDLKRNLFKIDVRAQKDEEKVFMRTVWRINSARPFLVYLWYNERSYIGS
ncbi:hupothetical protein [Streptococcus pyogenes]|nr:hupothetical protein [Streptococcus pyogenes]VGQ67803.1 hupothetical protein [Streptococcus pyogenes]VGQ76535.1 hupothetical protein [Streptococcus pyogenes]VGV15877.1 hupothetical protein [Streptococcus pyogenes]VHC90302.1 hupothetical protein [Streptococcus pyogenes]